MRNIFLSVLSVHCSDCTYNNQLAIPRHPPAGFFILAKKFNCDLCDTHYLLYKKFYKHGNKQQHNKIWWDFWKIFLCYSLFACLSFLMIQSRGLTEGAFSIRLYKSDRVSSCLYHFGALFLSLRTIPLQS